MGWYNGDFKTHTPGKIFISNIYSFLYYDAHELVEMATKPRAGSRCPPIKVNP
jgi:hypothetical protein